MRRERIVDARSASPLAIDADNKGKSRLVTPYIHRVTAMFAMGRERIWSTTGSSLQACPGCPCYGPVTREDSALKTQVKMSSKDIRRAVSGICGIIE